jgi:hypothetical protein
MAVNRKLVNKNEAVDLPPPPPIKFSMPSDTRPAMVQNVSSFADYYNQGQFDITPDFIGYIKNVENGVKAGLKDGKWFAQPSAEGGTKTIAYGHKLVPGENYPQGITDAQALEMLKNDINVAANRAKKLVDSKHGSGTWDSLDNTRKEMLTDFAFNSALPHFPKFMAGVVANDPNVVNTQYKRYYAKGKELVDRNRQFAVRYLKH